MAELVLTPERRDELSSLLQDPERLHAEYPKVADYWEKARVLPGTGDMHADAAFDLRFLHYMTAGTSGSENPYWDIVRPSVSTRDGRRAVDGGHADGSARLGYAQTILQEAYAYAIPSPETVDWIVRFCGGRRVAELGAGRGYWAAQLARAGLTVDAYESEPPDAVDNVSFPRASGQTAVWHDVGGLDDFATRSGAGVDEVLFLCWPPGWGNTMASEALAAFEQAGGRRLVFVGEPKGGMTGDDAFFDALAAHWRLESEDSQFVSWWTAADIAQGWVRE